MSTPRDIVHPPELQGLKRACAAMIRAYGGQEAAEAETGRSQSRISDYGRANTDAFAPVDFVMALEGQTHGLPGHPHVTRFLARQAGFVLVPRPGGDEAGLWPRSLTVLCKEFGEVSERVIQALADPASPGEVTAANVRELNIIGELDDVIEVASAMRALASHALETEGA